ncbi:MAG: hypothetical protein PF501_12665 [Salinisphaera sp.]|jgi:hypothetical protein|nr:hypothetical protein [Salinisphaera sp.]
MRVRTSRTELVHACAALVLLFASSAHADADYGAANYNDHHATDTSVTTTATPRGILAPDRNENDVDQITGASSARAQAWSATVPHRGMTQAQVRADYGTPMRVHPPAGKPPITRWDYAGFHVYFESDHVIHSVIPDDPMPLDHRSQLQPGRQESRR